ncbi:hypothetical protein D3C87_1217620 [compost metagenome]
MARERELKTAEEIRDEVQRRFDAERAEMHDDDGGNIRVHLPIRLAEPDESGCNWVIQNYTGDRTYFKMVGIGVFDVKAIWNLA